MEAYQEENNYPKAFLATGIIMGILIALCYFIVFKNPPPQEMGTGGILVNYGTSKEGMGDDYMSTEEPSKSPRPTHTKATKVTPPTPTPQKTQVEQADKKVVTQTTEDAPEVNDKTKKTTNAVTTSEPTKKAVKQTVDNRALFKGMSSKGNGNGDGTTNTPGNQGNPNGSNLSNNYNGTGSGNGGLALGNRSWVSRPTVDDNHQRAGKIIVQIQVDKNGNVISATAGAKGTTIVDYDLFNKCKQAALNAKFNPSDNAPDVQVGYITFTFKVK
ncbi:MAG TPA: energy transducer TonB [Mucilaginibacter sp.]